MYKLFNLHDTKLERFNNKPYYNGTWEPLKMEKNRMLPFQVNTAGNPLSVIQVSNGVEVDITGKLNGLTSIHSDYVSYNGTIFSDYIAEGRSYFKINNKYSEDVDVMDMKIRTDKYVSSNLLTSWNNNSFNTFTSTGANITSAISTDLTYQQATADVTRMFGGVTYRINLNVTINSGDAPSFFLWDNITSKAIFTWNVPTGNYEIDFTAPVTLYANIKVHNNYKKTNFKATCSLYRLTPEINDSVSSKYIKISISSAVDFGGTYYRGGFKQIIWKEATVEKGQGAKVEVIGDERNGVIIREKVTTATKYNIRLKVTESEYSAMAEALPAEWTVTDTSGKVFTCNDKELSDPDWYGGNGLCTFTFTDNINIFAYNNNEL